MQIRTTPKSPPATPVLPQAVLLDRDDTLIHDVAYNGDPARVWPIAGVAAALDRLRAAGVALGVVSNQSGVARGLIRPEQVWAVNAEVERLLGPFAAWRVCPHGDSDGCHCRKPAPGLIESACSALGADPASCVVIGDTGADVDAGLAAGTRSILVPTGRTLEREVQHARRSAAVARTLPDASHMLLSARG